MTKAFYVDVREMTCSNSHPLVLLPGWVDCLAHCRLKALYGSFSNHDTVGAYTVSGDVMTPEELD